MLMALRKRFPAWTATGTAFLALLALSDGAVAAGKGSAALAGNYDARVMNQKEVNRVLSQVSGVPLRGAPSPAQLTAQLEGMRQGFVRLQAAAPGATAGFSPITAGPEVVSAQKGPLSAPAPGRPGIDIVRNFLRTYSSLYGLSAEQIDALQFLGESNSPTGLRMVRVRQLANGVPVFQSETRFLLDREGRIWRSLGLLVPAGASVPPLTPAVSAPEALVQAMKAVGINLDVAQMRIGGTNAEGTRTEVLVNNEQIAGAVTSELLYFPGAPGQLVPAWRQIIFTTGEGDWNTIVDATTGTVLWRKNMREHVSTQDARFSVYVQADGETPADSPAPQSPTPAAPGAGTQFPEIARTTVSMFAAQDIVASQNGWIDDGGSTTTGNNVDACVDRVQGAGEVNVCDIGTLDNNGRPVGNPDANTNNRDFLGAAPRDYTYNPAPVGGNPDAGDNPTGVGAPQDAFRRGATTQLFYVSNWYHDKLFQLGFDEAAANFQNTNFSGMGLGGDRVLADVQDGSGTNNANFATPPDGQSGRMQMFRFTFPTPDRDGDLDSEIVIHELTHGTSNRLIGNADGLIWSPGRGMGEGWSDFYALSLLNNTNADNPNASYASGAYATYQLGGLTDNYVYGIRRFPYSTNNSINPLTWADADDVTANMSGGIPVSPLGFEFAGAFEVHNTGEIWAMTLWEVRSRIIADPAGAAGDVPTGNQTALEIVTDGMKMTPNNPSFTDARDAIILADCATNACANERWIWEGFADRGLGYGAVAPLGIIGFGNLGHMSLGESFDVPYLDVNSTSVNDSTGNNNGTIDPGEPIQLTVQLINPWRGTAFNVASATATLTTSTPGVTITDGTSTYPAIAAQGTANGDTFAFTVPLNAACGSSINFTITVTSSLGTRAVDFTVRVGNPTGTAAPVTYTDTPALAIPDGEAVGVFDTMTITDDFEIADINFRVDSLTHTFTGDLTVQLKAPNGYGGDLIWLRQILFGGGDGDNFTNTVIDDEAVNDLNQTTPAQAPYTGSWLPAFNSPVWLLFGDPAIFPDPVGQLSRMDGLSTQGTWTVHTADMGAVDVGTLNSWSMIVTPRAFTCTPFIAPPVVTATKTVSGTFNPGGTVTYTVTLSNTGAGNQPDNAGDEFNDTLPAGLTLVSANASSGSATTAGNTVNWNGVITAGGSVTITITATVNAGTGGQNICNQGTAHVDADATGGTNETNVLTDDPGTPAANDATCFVVAGTANVTATKTASGTPVEGGTITYTVVLNNTGTGVQGDNAGNEFTDTLPAGLTLVSAVATSGVVTTAANTVNWNGSIPAAGSVTITITATINAGTAGQTLTNQGSFSFDSNGDGTNDTNGTTDNPATPAAGDGTPIVVAGGTNPAANIPTLSEWGFIALALMLAGAALLRMRRRTA